MPAAADFQERLISIERLLSQFESVADPSLKTNVQELMQLVMGLHGAGLERMLEVIGAAPDGGRKIIQSLGRELVSNLLVLYGLHPTPLESRVADAVDTVRRKVRAHEGEVELLNIHDGTVSLRLQAHGHGCTSTVEALKAMVENALYQAAPDITAVVVEGADDDKRSFVPMKMLQKSAPALASAEKGGA